MGGGCSCGGARASAYDVAGAGSDCGDDDGNSHQQQLQLLHGIAMVADARIFRIKFPSVRLQGVVFTDLAQRMKIQGTCSTQ